MCVLHCHVELANEKNGAPHILLDLTIFLASIFHLISSFLFCLLLLSLKFLKSNYAFD